MKRLLLSILVLTAASLGRMAAQEPLSIKMGESSHWISLVSDKNLNFNTNIADYKGTVDATTSPSDGPYAFKAVGEEGGIVKLKNVGVVPKKTPIWIWGATGTSYSVTILDDDDLGTGNMQYEPSDFSNNLLKGALSENTLLIADGDYFLSSQDDEAHSAALTNMIGQYMPAGKALLRTGSTNVKLRLSILRDDDEAEGIDAVCTKDGQLIIYDPRKPSYNAAGQLVPGDAKGLHIQGGYKFYVR